jgi:hypothetical protein
MVQAALATSFWAAVEDCLVTFHHLERDAAAEKVSGLRRKLPKGPTVKCEKLSLEDMIYHSEPWYIACDLAQEELSLTQHQEAYENVLKANQLVWELEISTQLFNSDPEVRRPAGARSKDRR